MFGKIVTFFAGMTTLISCATSNVQEIKTLCVRDDIGNYIIKWETFPSIEGSVRIYASNVPDYFEETSPVGIIDIRDEVTTYITIDNTTRKYFLLSFNNQYKNIVGSRAVSADNIQNLRDMGGYVNNEEKTLKWGHIFRSGELDNMSMVDHIRLDNLAINTVVDLRSPHEYIDPEDIYAHLRTIHIPIDDGIDKPEVMERIKQGRMKKGDAILFMQDAYLHFVDKNSEQFAKALDLFLDKNNYPILFHDTLGKDRTGFLAALILIALGVPEETIMKDYLYSNDYINYAALAPEASKLDYDGQETVTTLLSANELFLGVVLKKIKKEYGSLEKYLEQKLNFTIKKQEKLKEIMLY